MTRLSTGCRFWTRRSWAASRTSHSLSRIYQIDQVLIAIPTADGQQMRRIVDTCMQTKVEVLTLPGVFELISGYVGIQRFRPVRVEDLLARDLVRTDTTSVCAFLTNKVVLVTGAGGSIGSELCRQIALCNPDALVFDGAR